MPKPLFERPVFLLSFLSQVFAGLILAILNMANPTDAPLPSSFIFIIWLVYYFDTLALIGAILFVLDNDNFNDLYLKLPNVHFFFRK